MIEFMFSVLGSVVFWILFFVVGFFAGTLVLKKLSKDLYGFIIGKNANPYGSFGLNYIPVIVILFFIYLFWPIILAIMAIGFIIKHVLWKSFCSGVKAVDSVIPDIQFKKREDGE